MAWISWYLLYVKTLVSPAEAFSEDHMNYFQNFKRTYIWPLVIRTVAFPLPTFRTDVREHILHPRKQSRLLEQRVCWLQFPCGCEHPTLTLVLQG